MCICIVYAHVHVHVPCSGCGPRELLHGDLTIISPTIVSEEKENLRLVKRMYCQRGEIQWFFWNLMFCLKL